MDQPVPTDDDLIAQLKAAEDRGEAALKAAWRAVYEAHRGAVQRVARRILDVRAGGAVMGIEPDDIVGDTFAAAMEQGVGKVDRLRPYLLQVARYKAIDAIRARVREEQAAGRVDVVRVVEDAEALAVLALRNEELRQHLEAATSQQQKAIIGAVLEGRATNDIAAELGVAGPRIAQLVRQGLKRIRPLMEADEAGLAEIERDGRRNPKAETTKATTR